MKLTLASETPVAVLRQDFETMLNFSRSVFSLKDNEAYLAAMHATLPGAAHVPTQWPSVLMGFDFHLTADGPKLIEINNNAGGLYIGDQRWLPQADDFFDNTLPQRLLSMFPKQWNNIAIMDDDVTQQYMYPEMCAYAELLRGDGRKVWVCSPEDLELQQSGLFIDGGKIDAIYNRHTDFYLDDHVLAHIWSAYREGQVVLNPHPRSYALIGDKSRMVDWWREGLLEACVDPSLVEQIRAVTPATHQLAEMDLDQAWAERKTWVFKPSARHGGKGVVLGKAMSRKRFAALDLSETIVQQLVPASRVEVDGREMKFDIRLYMHGEKLIALAGRVWSGQVTNFREAGSGWVALSIDD
ncbi:MAG: hypothetical protein Q9M17_03790 [Mariprofundus sp.]|nr:hypothetical protein [Mariprofundus sp.]